MHNELVLVKPDLELKSEILEYKQEYFNYGESNVNGSSGLAYFEDFKEWLNHVKSIEKNEQHNQPRTITYLSKRIEDNKLVGSLKLRVGLLSEIEEYNGHISYGVRPSERGKGYGKQQLELMILEAKKMQMNELLIVCDKNNTASANTIKSCRGVLSKEVLNEGVLQQHYLISLN